MCLINKAFNTLVSICIRVHPYARRTNVQANPRQLQSQLVKHDYIEFEALRFV